MQPVLVAASLLASATGAFAWGADGHHSVGYIAQAFLNTTALAFVEDALAGSKWNGSLGPAASWADEIKSGGQYAWASELHYVDAEDSPPATCNVDEERDCSNGKCILTAIANYTERVVDPDLSANQTLEALLFLDHFIGDLGQPLHVEAVAVGGNTISVDCDGSTTNLHSLWDSKIITKILADYDNGVTGWVTDLVARIKTGEYKSEKASWVACSSPNPADGCILEWAEDTNAGNCDVVFTYEDGDNLCSGSYYDDAKTLIELQIAKEGYRLAAWLNNLFP
ncbi:S1/P1 nuclease [Flagelloscypha sp. PMI_526]|nr:S1/P1 nuclease [Flagelloscypha sp. PMI_526]